VNQVVVELFAANSGFGAYLSHGSQTPYSNGADGGTGSGGLPAMLQASTDLSEGAQCTWKDGMVFANDVIPGCQECNDEGANEPYLNCSYTGAPGVIVNAAESFDSFRTIELATDTLDPVRQVLARGRMQELLTPWTLENPLTFYTSGSNFTAAIGALAFFLSFFRSFVLALALSLSLSLSL
jgi:hypothetical protein